MFSSCSLPLQISCRHSGVGGITLEAPEWVPTAPASNAAITAAAVPAATFAFVVVTIAVSGTAINAAACAGIWPNSIQGDADIKHALAAALVDAVVTTISAVVDATGATCAGISNGTWSKTAHGTPAPDEPSLSAVYQSSALRVGPMSIMDATALVSMLNTRAITGAGRREKLPPGVGVFTEMPPPIGSKNARIRGNAGAGYRVHWWGYSQPATTTRRS